MKTIAQIINSAELGDQLTDGKKTWTVVRYGNFKIAVPNRKTKNSFELWASCGVEKSSIMPGLKLVE